MFIANPIRIPDKYLAEPLVCSLDGYIERDGLAVMELIYWIRSSGIKTKVDDWLCQDVIADLVAKSLLIIVDEYVEIADISVRWIEDDILKLPVDGGYNGR